MRAESESQNQVREAQQNANIEEINRIKRQENKVAVEAAAKDEQNKRRLSQVEAERNAVSARLVGFTSPRLDHPGGEISTVDQRSRMVWINRGSVDHLEPHVKFGVYAADGVNMSNVKKAQVEIVRVVDDHTSQARIIDDSISNPIVQGDKIYTPLWSPGDQTHFALAGVMDLDGDGRDVESQHCAT